ncbi:MAG TPA: efflux transporter outer membrane subunit [Oleiagrimonas sp.]|nr:efflux transporter outer membrane subunit [Oleiagrimonas sp.]
MRLRLFPLVAACAMAVLLGACASSQGIKPSGHMIDAGSLHAERSLAGAALTRATWPRANWWTALGDPQLDALIAEALKHNPDIAIASARARKAAAKARIVDAGRKPGVKASASISGAHLPSTLVPAPLGGHFGWIKYGYLGFNWDLDLWGGKRAAWEAAVDQAHAAVVDTHAARLMVSVNVARAYAQLGYAFKQQAIAREELKRARGAHKLTAQRVHAGIDSKLQLKRGDAEVALAREQLAKAGHQVDAARVALSVLLGQGPDRGLDIRRPQLLTPARVAVPANLPANLLGRRPDLVAARWRVEAAGQGIKAAKARFLPNISLGAMAGLVNKGGDTLFQLPARFFQIAPAISLPIFDGGRLRANLSGTDATYDLAVATYNKTLIGAINQVANELNGLQSLKAQVAAQQQALQAAREAWELSEQRYKAGVGSYLEALNVRQQLLKAEQAAAALHARQVDLSIQLIHALGGGFHADVGAMASGQPAVDAEASAHAGSTQAIAANLPVESTTDRATARNSGAADIGVADPATTPDAAATDPRAADTWTPAASHTITPHLLRSRVENHP